MKHPFLFLVLTALGSLVGCGPKPDTQEKPIVPMADYSLARSMANAVASDLVQGDMKDLFQRLDPGFHMVVNSDQELQKQVKKMEGMYGRLLEWRFKMSQTGVRKDGVWRRGSRAFLYAVKTSKYPYGKYFLKVEVVPAYDGQGPIDVSGFGYFTFNDGIIPENLK
jgi:hypothetical protein